MHFLLRQRYRDAVAHISASSGKKRDSLSMLAFFVLPCSMHSTGSGSALCADHKGRILLNPYLNLYLNHETLDRRGRNNIHSFGCRLAECRAEAKLPGGRWDLVCTLILALGAEQHVMVCGSARG